MFISDMNDEDLEISIKVRKKNQFRATSRNLGKIFKLKR